MQIILMFGNIPLQGHIYEPKQSINDGNPP